MTLLQGHSHRLLVIVGASGAGKDSVLRGWLASLPQELRPHLARRTITRAGGDSSEAHEAIDEAGFGAAQAAGAFAFAWQAHGLHYGVRWSELAPLGQGRWVAMNGSRAHLGALRAAAAQAHVIEVVAADAVRQARLNSRGREAGESVLDRLQRSVPAGSTDRRITNDGDLATAVAHLDGWWQGLSAPVQLP